MKKHILQFLAKIRLFSAIAICAGGFASTSYAQAEFRALWVDAWGSGFLTPTQVTTLVSHCRTYNFNAVIVQMRRRGDAFYFPQAPNGDPRTEAISSGYDALQELITKCHTGTPRIEVHAWAVTHLIWSDSSPPSQPGHVYNLHPEYLMRDSSGNTFMAEGYYLDPGHPDASQWNYNMVKDVVSRYDIDGFHWDYIRYPQQNSGYNPTAIARYNAEFGLTGQPSSTDSNFSTWRRRQVTDFIRWTTSDMLSIKSNIVMSASVFANRSDAFSNRFQDWAGWNNEGIIDVSMPMNYSDGNSTFNSRTDDAFTNQGVRRCYIGQGSYLNTRQNTVVQLNYVRNKPLLGTVLFSYRTCNSGTPDQTTTFNYIRNNYQPTWRNTPTLPWKTNPTKGIVKGTITRQDNGAVVYNATVTITTSPSRNQKSEAHGKYAFFEVFPGTYTVSATATGLGTVNGTAVVQAGKVVNVNLALPTGGGGGSGIIVDNTAATTIGSWTAGSSSTDKFGANYVFKNAGSGSAYLQFTPNIPSTGSYQIYEWHPQGGNRTTDARHVVTYSGGTQTLLVNQQINGGQWNLLGTFQMSAGTSGNVRINDSFSTGTVVLADAIRFLSVPGDIIIDNPAATFVGTWTLATLSPDKFGADYRHKGPGSGSGTATFRPNITTAGNYEVYAWHPQGSNRTTAAQHVITHSGGSQTVTVNQQINGGQWILLGTFNFSTGTTGNVRITDNFSNGSVVMADAVKFVFISP